MRAQMCPDVYFGDNNSAGARRRAISALSLSLSYSPLNSYTGLYKSGSLQIVETKASETAFVNPILSRREVFEII